MSTNEPSVNEQTPVVQPGNYSPVSINNRDTVGAFFLGILSLIFAIAWMRAEARNREMIRQHEMEKPYVSQ